MIFSLVYSEIVRVDRQITTKTVCKKKINNVRQILPNSNNYNDNHITIKVVLISYFDIIKYLV
jgi:hypothetical protein